VGEQAERRAAKGWRVPYLAARFGKPLFIAGLGIGQIASWGSLYYSFPLIAERMGHDLGLSKPEIYGAATIGLLIASFTAYPVGVASRIDSSRRDKPRRSRASPSPAWT
jgi:hypothetical protein